MYVIGYIPLFHISWLATHWQLRLLLVAWVMGDGESLTHWGLATHICIGKLTTIGSDNGLSPGRRQAIIWPIAGNIGNGPLGTNFSEILIRIQTFSFKKMHLKMSSGKWRTFCLGLNVLTHWGPVKHIYICITNPWLFLIIGPLIGLWSKFEAKYNNLYPKKANFEKCISKCCLQNHNYFVSSSIS